MVRTTDLGAIWDSDAKLTCPPRPIPESTQVPAHLTRSPCLVQAALGFLGIHAPPPACATGWGGAWGDSNSLWQRSWGKATWTECEARQPKSALDSKE